MAGIVKAIVNPKNLELTPDYYLNVNHSDKKNEFDVTVLNASDKFASFQLELEAKGFDINSPLQWYTVSPEICTKKPPGSETKFHVIITKPPIPAYENIIDLTLRVFSIEDATLATNQKLTLKINKPSRPVKIYLPVKELSVLPGDEVKIPVIVYNLSPDYAEINLNISELESNWLIAGDNKKLSIEPGDSQEVYFRCQPPNDSQQKAISDRYSFTIEASAKAGGQPVRDKGILEVLPLGIVRFECEQPLQVIPGKGKKKTNSATYKLDFINDSNLDQIVNINPADDSIPNCKWDIPAPPCINPGKQKRIDLRVHKNRPWLGLKRSFTFKVNAELNPLPSPQPELEVYTNPNKQVLELQILPIIPILLQIGLGCLIPLILWLTWWTNPQPQHQGAVNSVRIIGNGGQVISGSSDHTIKLWQVDNSPIPMPASRRLKYNKDIANDIQKAVRVIRQSPREDNVIAAGLENGDIKLWETLRQNQTNFIKLSNNRVFDLLFTPDSRYLFSGHGSGEVQLWSVDGNNTKRIQTKNFEDVVSALAIGSTQPNSPELVVGGQYNQLRFWDWRNQKVRYIKYFYEGKNDKFTTIMGKNDYINSIATTNQLLVTADNQGYITLWDIQKRQCQPKITNIIDKNQQQKPSSPTEFECEMPILAQWRDGHQNQPVSSVAITPNGCYLASAGNDGRVMLWTLKKDTNINKKPQGKVIVDLPGVRFNSVDIKALDNYLLMASGDDNKFVRIYRITGVKDNAKCE